MILNAMALNARRGLLTLGLALALPSMLTAQISDQGDVPPAPTQDVRVTTFFSSGQFEEAVARSLEENKPLLIKGYNRIVDDLALEDSNKGHC